MQNQVILNSTEITASLKSMVEQFNGAYEKWRKATGCEANLRWSYQSSYRALEVGDIKYPVYTMEPSERTIRELAGNQPPVESEI